MVWKTNLTIKLIINYLVFKKWNYCSLPVDHVLLLFIKYYYLEVFISRTNISLKTNKSRFWRPRAWFKFQLNHWPAMGTQKSCIMSSSLSANTSLLYHRRLSCEFMEEVSQMLNPVTVHHRCAVNISYYEYSKLCALILLKFELMRNFIRNVDLYTFQSYQSKRCHCHFLI